MANDKGETNEGTTDASSIKKNPKAEAAKPKAVSLDFATIFNAKKQPDQRGVIYLAPEEIAVDREEVGMGPQDTVRFFFRPFAQGEHGEIRETVKDFPEEEWAGEYYDEIILRCLVDPDIPNNADGRRVISRWLSGTKQVIAQAVINQSGMGPHEVRSAKADAELSAKEKLGQ